MVVMGAGPRGSLGGADLAGRASTWSCSGPQPPRRPRRADVAGRRLLRQLGGEVVGPFQKAYCGRGRARAMLVPSFPQLPGEDTSVLTNGHVVGDDFAWISDADARATTRPTRPSGKLAATVDPDDPGRTRTPPPRLRPVGRAAARGVGGDTERGAGPRPVDAGRCRPSRSSARRCSRTCARRRPRAATASTTTRCGSAFAWPRDRPPWRCGWPPSSATASATARRSRACACRRRGSRVTAATGERFECSAVVCAIRWARCAGWPSTDVSRAARVARPPAPRARGEGLLRLRQLLVGGAGPERHDVLREGHDGRHLASARGHPLGARPARAPGGPSSRPRRSCSSRTCSRRWWRRWASAPAIRRRSSSGAGASTPGRGLHHQLAARGRDGRRTAARHARPPFHVAARTSGCAATWRARCEPDGAPHALC